MIVPVVSNIVVEDRSINRLWKSAMDLATIVGRASGHVEAEIGGQTVMMSISQGSYFALESTGRRIWELMAEPVQVGDIVDTLVEEYEIDRTQCKTEVLAFLRQLQDKGLATETGL